MAANYITINSRFKPFSLAEMMVPYVEYGKQYNASQDVLSSTMNTAQSIGAKLNPDNDKLAYSMYKNYTEDLQSKTDDLMKYGYNGNTARNLFNLKKRYSNEIVKIGDAITRREEQNKAEMEAYMKDPSIIIDNPAMLRSIDDFMLNPDYKGHLLSLNEVKTAAAAEALALSKTFRGATTGLTAGGNYYTRKEMYGLTPEEYSKLVNGDSSAPADAVDMRNKLFNQAVTRGTFTNEQKTEILKTINSAMSFSIGVPKFTDLPNQLGLLNARAAGSSGSGVGYADNPYDVHSSLSDYTLVNSADATEALKDLKANIGPNAGKFSAQVFGRHGEYNPILLYEQYHKHPETFAIDHPGMRLIKENTYKQLKNKLNYGSNTNPLDIINTADKKVNSLAYVYQAYELGNQSILKDQIMQALRGSQSREGIFKYIDPSTGETYSDKKHKLSPDSFKASDIYKVRYIPRYNDRVVVQLTNGEMYTVDPDALSTQLRNAIGTVSGPIKSFIDYNPDDPRIKYLMEDGLTIIDKADQLSRTSTQRRYDTKEDPLTYLQSVLGTMKNVPSTAQSVQKALDYTNETGEDSTDDSSENPYLIQ